MSTTNMYVGINSATMVPCSLTKPASAQARKTWLCTGCCAPKPDVREIDVFLEERPTDRPMNIVTCRVSVIYKPFLDKFPEELVRRDLYLGRVFGPKGEEVPEWVTFRGRKRLIIRGSKHAGFRKCEHCGRDVYFAMGKKYLYPSPPDDATIFERAGGGGLILPNQLFEQLDIGKWRKLDIKRLPVLDSPKDGFGALPNA